jgi:hypothetical protein
LLSNIVTLLVIFIGDGLHNNDENFEVTLQFHGAVSLISNVAQIAEVPKLTKGCNDFVDEAQQLLERHKLNRTLLGNLGTLLDLLEIPQLMDT